MQVNNNIPNERNMRTGDANNLPRNNHPLFNRHVMDMNSYARDMVNIHPEMRESIRQAERNYENSFWGGLRKMWTDYQNYSRYMRSLPLGERIGKAFLNAVKIFTGIFFPLACSSASGPDSTMTPTGEHIGSNIYTWGNPAVNGVSPDDPNKANVTFYPDSGIGISLAGLLQRAGSLPSTLTVDGQTLGTVNNKFTVGIMDTRANELSSLAAKENRDMTTAERNEFNRHVKYVTYNQFVGSSSNDLSVNLVASSFNSFANIFDHTENTNPYLSFTNLALDADNTFHTQVNSTGDGVLGALNQDGWNITSLSGNITVDALGSGKVYYVVEDALGNQEEAQITGFSNGVHTMNRASFTPTSNIVRNGAVTSASVFGNGISFTMNNGGYVGIGLDANSLITIYDTDPVNLYLSGVTSGQSALIQDADGNSITYSGLVNGTNSLYVNNFLENARVTGAGSSVTRGSDAYTATTILSRLSGSAISLYANEAITPNANTKFKFVMTIPNTGDLSLINNLSFRAYNYSNKSRYLHFSKTLSYYVTDQQVVGSNRVVTLEIPNNELSGESLSTFGQLAYINLTNKTTLASDLNFTFSNYQIDQNGTGYGTYYPLLIDRTRIKTIAVYNGSGSVMNGSMTNASIDGTSFIAAQGSAADWTSITKIMVRTSGVTANSTIRFNLLSPTFSPLEYGADFSGNTQAVTFSSAEDSNSFNMSLYFRSMYTIFP